MFNQLSISYYFDFIIRKMNFLLESNPKNWYKQKISPSVSPKSVVIFINQVLSIDLSKITIIQPVQRRLTLPLLSAILTSMLPNPNFRTWTAISLRTASSASLAALRRAAGPSEVSSHEDGTFATISTSRTLRSGGWKRDYIFAQKCLCHSFFPLFIWNEYDKRDT